MDNNEFVLIKSVCAHPSAIAGPAAVAGLRAPPTASGAPARPCQRRKAAAPSAAAAAAASAPPRRAITRPDLRDTDPRLPTSHSCFSIGVYRTRSVYNPILSRFSYIEISLRALTDGLNCRPVLEHRR